MAQVCRAGKVAKGTCANKNNNAMKDKTDNKAQVRCAQKLCGILAPSWGIKLAIICITCAIAFGNTLNAQDKNKAVNTDGFYYKIDDKKDTIYTGKRSGYKIVQGIEMLIFYNNNRFLSYGITFPDSVHIDSSFLIRSKNEIIENFTLDLKYRRWGYYKQMQDSIIVQIFISGYNGAFTKAEAFWFFKIKGTTVMLEKLRCRRCDYKEFIYSPPQEYKFVPFSAKPDSSQGWLYDKKWYKKRLQKFMEE